jgi:hypothetical protein
MSENKEVKKTDISNARTLEELADFWDSNSLADHWDDTEEVEFEVRAKRRRRITLSPDVFEKIEFQARLQGVLPETLVNVWLTEKLQKAK